MPLAPQRHPQPKTAIPTAVSEHISLRGAQWHRGHVLGRFRPPRGDRDQVLQAKPQTHTHDGGGGKVRWGGDTRRLTPRAELPWSAMILEMCIFRLHPEDSRGLQGEEADPLQAQEPVLGCNCRLREQASTDQGGLASEGPCGEGRVLSGAARGRSGGCVFEVGFAVRGLASKWPGGQRLVKDRFLLGSANGKELFFPKPRYCSRS